MALRLSSKLIQPLRNAGVRAMSTGEYGSGSGKGGGSGGSIRDAGGSFGKMEAAHEEEYFRKLRTEQFKQLRQTRAFHDQEIRKHEEAINRHKKRLHDLKEKGDSTD